jgi:hypothetical protein|tara:strand:+ start:366 stop:1103 length:738 start_codon:yes stop_codon:yes gene_type:complete
MKRRVLIPFSTLSPAEADEPHIDTSKRDVNQRITGDNNTQISAGGNVKTDEPQEPNPMDSAMEEIRAAQAQREEQARKFEQMMSGSFAASFPQNISQEMADMIAAFKLQGMSNEEATQLATQQMGEGDVAKTDWSDVSFCDCCSPMDNAFALMKAKKKSKPFHGYNPNKHNKKGGLNAKGRAAAKRKTGANLKPPVTKKPSKLKPGSKSAKRRKSFCARMSGVKGPTSKKGKLTPKGASLKRWNC